MGKRNKKKTKKNMQFVSNSRTPKTSLPAPSGLQGKLKTPVKISGVTFPYEYADSILSGRKGHLYVCTEFPKTHTYAMTDDELSSVVSQMQDWKKKKVISLTDIKGNVIFEFGNMVVEKTKHNFK